MRFLHQNSIENVFLCGIKGLETQAVFYYDKCTTLWTKYSVNPLEFVALWTVSTFRCVRFISQTNVQCKEISLNIFTANAMKISDEHLHILKMPWNFYGKSWIHEVNTSPYADIFALTCLILACSMVLSQQQQKFFLEQFVRIFILVHVTVASYNVSYSKQLYGQFVGWPFKMAYKKILNEDYLESNNKRLLRL